MHSSAGPASPVALSPPAPGISRARRERPNLAGPAMPAADGTRTLIAHGPWRLHRGPPLLQRPAHVRYRQQALTGGLMFRNWWFRSCGVVLAHRLCSARDLELTLHLYRQSACRERGLFTLCASGPDASFGAEAR